MKIATWNIERLKTAKKLPAIIEQLNAVDADILILTEADERVRPQYKRMFLSTNIGVPCISSPSEHRTIIYTNYELADIKSLGSSCNAMLADIMTPFGELKVYGTVIGTYGNRHASFKTELEEQLFDFDGFAKHRALCIAGDFNISFSDNYYYTKHGRDALNACFERNNLVNLTAELPEAIDHIVVSKSFVGDRTVKLTEWNLDKSLSDHKGVCVEF